MKKFVVISHVTSEAMAAMSSKSPEEMQAGMKPWMDWNAKLGSQMIDFGAPLYGGVEVAGDGSTVPSVRDIAGYMIIEAENKEEAIKLLLVSPLFPCSEGCTIEVHEAQSMSM